MTGRALCLVALWPGTLAAQVGRHPEPGFYVQAGGGAAMVDAEPRYGPQFGLHVGVGLGWVSTGGLGLAAHLEQLWYGVAPDFELTLTEVALEPTLIVATYDYTALYVGGRAVLGRRHIAYSFEFLDPASGSGGGLGLVAGARSQASRVVGFNARITGSWLWFGDLRADGLRIDGTTSRAVHFNAHVAITLSP